MDWQTMETAPKDGTEIIGAYFMDWGDGNVTVYGPWTVQFARGKWWASHDGSIVVEYMSDFGTEYKRADPDPTIWMSLPVPNPAS